jgi:hypothetical protein
MRVGKPIVTTRRVPDSRSGGWIWQAVVLALMVGAFFLLLWLFPGLIHYVVKNDQNGDVLLGLLFGVVLLGS